MKVQEQDEKSLDYNNKKRYYYCIQTKQVMKMKKLEKVLIVMTSIAMGLAGSILYWQLSVATTGEVPGNFKMFILNILLFFISNNIVKNKIVKKYHKLQK